MGKQKKRKKQINESIQQNNYDFCGTLLLKPKSGGIVSIADYNISGILHNHSDDDFTLILVKNSKICS